MFCLKVLSTTYSVNILEIVHDSECDKEECLDDQGPEKGAEGQWFWSVGEGVVGGENVTGCGDEVDDQCYTLVEELEPVLVSTMTEDGGWCEWKL